MSQYSWEDKWASSTLGQQIAIVYRVVPYTVAIYVSYDIINIMKKAIVTESKPKIKRKGIVAKTESSNHKHSKNYRKVNKGQGKCSKSRRSNG